MKLHAASRWLSQVLLGLIGTLSAWAQPVPDSLDFEQTFSVKDEPAQVHFVAEYGQGSQRHRLEVWRDAERRLLRRTDQRLQTLAWRGTDAADLRLVQLDLTRKIRTDIDRTALARLGQWVDWFGLAHGLNRPKGPYRLTQSTPHPAPNGQPVAPCQWLRLEQGPQTSFICWSSSLKLPLLLMDDSARVIWRVRRFDTQPIAASLYEINDDGFVRNDASADINAD